MADSTAIQLPRQAGRTAACGAVPKLGRDDHADRDALRFERGGKAGRRLRQAHGRCWRRHSCPACTATPPCQSGSGPASSADRRGRPKSSASELLASRAPGLQRRAPLDRLHDETVVLAIDDHFVRRQLQRPRNSHRLVAAVPEQAGAAKATASLPVSCFCGICLAYAMPSRRATPVSCTVSCIDSVLSGRGGALHPPFVEHGRNRRP